MRYFIEIAYKGERYSGFQVQANANSVQAELEKALAIFYRKEISCTGSSRTDAGVHALQNFFHADTNLELSGRHIYNINAILPDDIVIKAFHSVPPDAHCRFDAIWRKYRYVVYQEKDPFLVDRAYYFPYALDEGRLQEAAKAVMAYRDFSAFSKRNTQVKTFECSIMDSVWRAEGRTWVYEVRANRFLRGMVRGLVGTMLQVGRGKIDLNRFREILESGDSVQVDFSVPGQGLFLLEVRFPDGMLGG